MSNVPDVWTDGLKEVVYTTWTLRTASGGRIDWSLQMQHFISLYK